MKKISLTSWDHLFGFLSLFLIFSLTFFPDEKLIRLKLQYIEISIFALVFLAGLRLIFSEERPSLKPKIIYFAVGAWGLVQLILWMASPEKSLANPEMRRVVLGIGAFLAFGLYPFKGYWREDFIFFWAGSAALISIYGLLQYLGGIGPIMVPQLNRIIATFGNPIFFAAYLVVSILITLAAHSLTKKKGVRILLIAALLIQITALYYTKTRAAWISLAGVLFLYGVAKVGLKKIPLWVWGAVFLIIFVFMIKTQDTWKRDQGHLMIWRDTIAMWSEKPWTGVGLGAFHTNFPDYAQEDLKSKWPKGKFIVNYAHNEYIQVLSEGGIVGAFFFLGMIGLYLIWLGRHIKDEPSYFTWLSLAPAALLIQNFFSVDMRFNITFAIFFLLMGLTLTLLQKESEPSPLAGSPMPLKLISSALWAGFMGLVLFPQLMRPYRAHKEFSSQIDFFDQRLLDPAKSIQQLEELSAKYPTETAVLEKLAYVYAKEMKSTDKKINREMTAKAIEAYQRLLTLNPDHIAAHNNLANVYYTTGRVKEAINEWEKVLEINPEFVDVHLNLGKILYVRGELKESARHFEHVLKVDPKNAEAVVYMKRMIE